MPWLPERRLGLIDGAARPDRGDTPSAKPGAAHVPDRPTKLQAQLDAQGKQIDETRGDLANTRTELTGSIAHTHDELVLLEKKGEKNYYEFDLGKSKQFQREGPIEISLRKANQKNQYADLQLIVEDRTLIQKHVNAYQPVVFYSDKEQPIQVVINQVSKDHIHGYVSAPKYKQSELATVADAGTNTAAAPDATEQTVPRKKASSASAAVGQRHSASPDSRLIGKFGSQLHGFTVSVGAGFFGSNYCAIG